MTQPVGRSKPGRGRSPGKERASPRVGPLLGAPPPITFRTPQRPKPTDGAPEIRYCVLSAAPGDTHGILEVTALPETRIPALDIVCCVTGVALAKITPTILERPLLVRFSIPDVPGNIRLEASDPADTSVNIQHPPARMRSFGVERVQARRPIATPKLPHFIGFRRRP